MNLYKKSTIFFSALFYVAAPTVGNATYAQASVNASDSIQVVDSIMQAEPDSAETKLIDLEQASFIPPFDFPIAFAGNFGEIRANHFHGGLDFKTGGVIGKPVRALADGYISRISVTRGSGYILYVRYNNGYTTINRHLSAFIGNIAKRVETLQYEKESWEVNIVPKPNEYPVKAGQQIAWSGNTGYSFGPHLHLDMFETATGDFIDPLPFFKKWVKDTMAPRAESIMFFPQAGQGEVNGKQTLQAFRPNYTQPVTAWGIIGVGLRAHDYMNGVSNHYGVRIVTLEVDGKEVFRSDVGRFSANENRMINSWTYGSYMKSFIDPGNTLRMLHAFNGDRGLIDINEERPYRFVYTLQDAFGNTSKVHFVVQGRKMPIRPVEHREKYVFRWNKVNYLQEPGLELIIPRGRLYHDVWLNYAVRADSGDIAFTYQLTDERVPLQSGCDLRIGLRRHPLADTTKYYVARVNARGGKSSAGGKYEKGFMKTRILELGTYTVAIDTVPPQIIPVSPKSWARSKRIVYRIKDKESGVRSYRGTIDGKYALFGIPNAINGSLVYDIDPKRVKRGGKHTVEITVTDNCGNIAVEKTVFLW
mgnify:CR=1 FL=1